jgi:lysophospholipase L1-like esterase
MFECLIMGDSIAVGTQHFRKECVAYATGGLNSHQWLNKNIQRSPFVAKTVIISLGTNDHKYVKTEEELRTIRQLTQADRVYWILPANNLKASEVPIQEIQRVVKKVASEYNDIVLPIPVLQKDGIHPSHAGYSEIAYETRGN